MEEDLGSDNRVCSVVGTRVCQTCATSDGASRTAQGPVGARPEPRRTRTAHCPEAQRRRPQTAHDPNDNGAVWVSRTCGLRVLRRLGFAPFGLRALWALRPFGLRPSGPAPPAVRSFALRAVSHWVQLRSCGFSGRLL